MARNPAPVGTVAHRVYDALDQAEACAAAEFDHKRRKRLNRARQDFLNDRISARKALAIAKEGNAG